MKVHDIDLIRNKIQLYCAYQERCHQDVIKKLKSWGLFSNSIDFLLTELSDHDFLNEERFSRSFVRGKFRIKNWGRIKISLEMKKKSIHQKFIDIAMTEIKEDEYSEIILKLLRKKNVIESETNLVKRKEKLTRYLLSKGFEFHIIKLNLDKLKL